MTQAGRSFCGCGGWLQDGRARRPVAAIARRGPRQARDAAAQTVGQAKRELGVGIALRGGLPQPRERGGFVARRAVAVEVADGQAKLRGRETLLRRAAETQKRLAELVLLEIHHAQVREPAHIHRPSAADTRASTWCCARNSASTPTFARCACCPGSRRATRIWRSISPSSAKTPRISTPAWNTKSSPAWWRA